jgi:cation transport ATPase
VTHTLEAMARRVGLTLLFLSLPIAVLAFVCWWTGHDNGPAGQSAHSVGGLILLVLAVSCCAVGMAVATAVPPVLAHEEDPPARV